VLPRFGRTCRHEAAATIAHECSIDGPKAIDMAWHCGVVTKVIMGLHSTVVKGDKCPNFYKPVGCTEIHSDVMRMCSDCGMQLA